MSHHHLQSKRKLSYPSCYQRIPLRRYNFEFMQMQYGCKLWINTKCPFIISSGWMTTKAGYTAEKKGHLRNHEYRLHTTTKQNAERHDTLMVNNGHTHAGLSQVYHQSEGSRRPQLRHLSSAIN